MNRHHSWFPVHTYELDEACRPSLPPAVFGSSPVVRTFFADPNRVLFSGFRLHPFDDRCEALLRESDLFDVVQFIRMNSYGKDRPVHTYELGRRSPAEASGQRRAHSRRRSERSKAQAAEDYASGSSTDVDGGYMPDDWLLSQFIRMNSGGKCRPVHMYELGDGSRIESSGQATLCPPQSERSAAQAAEDYKSGLSTVFDGGFMPHGWLSSQFIRMNSGGMRRPVHTYEPGVGSRIESSGQQATLCPPQSERSAAQAAKDYTSGSSTIVDGGFMLHGWLSSQFIRMNSGGKRRPVHTYELGVGSHIESSGQQATLCLRWSECSEAQAAKDYTSGSSTVVDGGFMPHGSLSSQFIRMNRSSAQLPYEQAFGNEFEAESDPGSRCATFVLDAASAESDETSSAIWGRRTPRTQHVTKTTRKLPVHTYEFGSPPPGFAFNCAGAQFIRMNHGPGGTCTLPTLMVHTYEPTSRARMPHLPPSASALPPTEPRHRAGFGVSGVHVLEIRPMT